MSDSEVFKKNTVVIFEGIMGSGKSTQARELETSLSGKYSVSYLDTRGVYPVIRALRPDNPKTLRGVIQEAFFFQFMNWIRFRSQEKYDVLIVDRFLLSNCVYTLEKLNRLDMSHQPDVVRNNILSPFGLDVLEGTVTVYLDCPVDIAKSRIAKRERSEFDELRERRAQLIYSQELKDYAHQVITIDGAKERGAVHSDICASLESVLMK